MSGVRRASFLWFSSAILFSLFLFSPALALSTRELRIENFQSEVLVMADGTIDVTENIQAHFVGGPWHGLYRTIPVEYVTPQGLNYSLFLDVKRVTDGSGRTLKYETSRERHYRKLKIYVPDADNSTQTISLEYVVSDALRFFDDHDELYWNVTGDDWDVPNRLGGSGCSTLTNPGNPNNYIKTQCFAVPVAPSLAFWNANCSPAPVSVGGPVSFPLCFNLRGNAGRNILIGPGLTELDFSLFKNNYIKRISERFNVQFRAEIFNILNHANFAPPPMPTNSDIFDGTGTPSPTAGVLTRTTTTAREIQFAVKVIF